MTMPDDTTVDVVPPSERGKDMVRGGAVDNLTRGSSRPLTDDEKKAAEHDHPRGERVYAPAEARVPKEPIPGDRERIEESLGPDGQVQHLPSRADGDANPPRR